MRAFLLLAVVAFASVGATSEDGDRLTCTSNEVCFEPPAGSQGPVGTPEASTAVETP